jgi:uncharacterized cupin superfamily protein
MASSEFKTYAVSSTVTSDYEPFLVDGTAYGEVHWLRTSGSDDRVLAVGMWRAEPMSFPYPFGNDETIHALEGELEIQLEDGEIVDLKPGDIASFAKGVNSTWTVKTPFKKFFVVSG